MIGRIQFISLNSNISQKKSHNNISNPTNYNYDKFTKSDKALSFNGNDFFYHKVSDNFIRGNKPDTGDIIRLKNMGVKTIIDLIGDGNYGKEAEILKVETKKLGLKYINIPLRDDKPPSKKQVMNFLNILKESNSPAYVHCNQDEDRTGLMTAIYLVEKMKFSFNFAYQDMLEKGHDFFENYKLDKFFEDYYIEKFCDQRGENPDNIRKSANTIRQKKFWRLNKNTYNGMLTIDLLKQKYN
jgi:protein tyrosine phosphatase (PTP) superfamily phosphohydrolase (DUF442 family)